MNVFFLFSSVCLMCLIYFLRFELLVNPDIMYDVEIFVVFNGNEIIWKKLWIKSWIYQARSQFTLNRKFLN